MPFDEFAASEPEAPTTQPITDEEIINLVCTENDAPQEESNDEEEENPPAKLIKSTNEFLAIINKQKAFMKRNKPPVELVGILGCIQNNGRCVERHYYCRLLNRKHIGDGFNRI